MESHGAFSASALSFLATLGERLTGTSDELHEDSVMIKRFNLVLINESFVSANEQPDL